MTDLDHAVATLAAVLAPDRARQLVRRLGTLGAEGAAARVTSLAAAPRHERLRTLAAALAQEAGSAEARAEAAAGAERPRVAAILRDLARRRPPGRASSAVLVRACRERLGM